MLGQEVFPLRMSTNIAKDGFVEWLSKLNLVLLIQYTSGMTDSVDVYSQPTRTNREPHVGVYVVNELKLSPQLVRPTANKRTANHQRKLRKTHVSH